MSASNPEHITPTVGRKLWLYVDTSQPRRGVMADVTIYDSREPMDASIAYVKGNMPNENGFWYITVAFADQAGRMHSAMVPLRQEGQQLPNAREWCEWMPYQRGQAKKADEPAPREAGNLIDAIASDPVLASAWLSEIRDRIKAASGPLEAARDIMKQIFMVDVAQTNEERGANTMATMEKLRAGHVANPQTISGTAALVNAIWDNAQAKMQAKPIDRFSIESTGKALLAKLGASPVSFGSKLAKDVTVQGIEVTEGCGNCDYCRGCAEAKTAPGIVIPPEWALEPMTTTERAAAAVDAFLAETSGEALKAYLEPRTVTNADLNAAIVSEYYHVVPGTTLTLCVLTLRNGFTVTGESACVDPAKFDANLGRKYAFDQAHEKLWPLLGYALKDQLYHELLAAEADRALRITKLGDNA